MRILIESLKTSGQEAWRRGVGKVQWLAGSMAGDSNAPIVNGYVVFYLALIVAGLVLVGGAVLEWHHGSAQGNVAVDILWRVTWVIYQVLKVTLVIVGGMWIYRRFRAHDH